VETILGLIVAAALILVVRERFVSKYGRWLLSKEEERERVPVERTLPRDSLWHEDMRPKDRDLFAGPTDS
jgi:hypothetical protein